MDRLDEIVRAYDERTERAAKHRGRSGAVFEPLVTFDQDKHDHYQRIGEPGTCIDRVPAKAFYKGDIPVPRDAHVQCKTCANAARCFASEQDVEDPDTLDGEHEIDESEWSDNY